MKKLLLMTLLVAMLLTGCGNNTDDVSVEDSGFESILTEDIIEETILYEDVIVEDVIEETWVSEEYLAELEFNSQTNNWD